MHYTLFFNESTQEFFIIPNGVTINHTHGNSILETHDLGFLRGFSRAFRSLMKGKYISHDELMEAATDIDLDVDVLVD